MFSYEERDYLQEQTIAEVVKNALQIYRTYFRKFFFSYFLLLLPATLLGIAGMVIFGDNFLLGFAVYEAVGFVAAGVASLIVMVVVSDICLGELPSVKRAWKHISVFLVVKLLLTNLLVYSLFLILGLIGLALAIFLDKLPTPAFAYIFFVLFLMLLLPALVSWFLFVPAIVVLENRWGFRAMKRSVTLGYDYHLRNFVIVCLMFGIVTLVPLILYVVSLFTGNEWAPVLGFFLYYITGFLIQPLGLIYIILLYYDIRVRKEGYDSAALAEDLRH